MGSGLFGSRANSIMLLKSSTNSEHQQFMSPRQFQSKSSLQTTDVKKKAKRYHVNNYLEDIASAQFLPPVTSPRSIPASTVR